MVSLHIKISDDMKIYITLIFFCVYFNSLLFYKIVHFNAQPCITYRLSWVVHSYMQKGKYEIR